LFKLRGGWRMSRGDTNPSDSRARGAGWSATRRLRAPLCALLLAGGAGLALPEGKGSAAPAAPEAERPNVLVVMTDDQTLEQMRVLREVRSQIGDRGATFANSFVNFPLCCPSRATFFTGQYARNHRVLENVGPLGGFDRLRSENTLAVWLEEAGYHTGVAGKYLNEYGRQDPTLVPPGFSEWYAALTGSIDDVYDYKLNENGTVVQYGDESSDFKQDVITAKANAFLARNAPAPDPFFLFVGYTAPHGAGPEPNPQPPGDCDGEAPKPAPRHAAAFEFALPPRPPSYNEAEVADKPADIRAMPPFDSETEAKINRNYRCALESLLSVNEGVELLLRTLRRNGELRNTVVMFTSDNGFFFGEHRIKGGKRRFYEESSRVPLMIRGPGIPAGTVVRELVVNADLAPTIVELTGIEAGLRMDGMSLMPLIAEPNRWIGRELLIESDGYRAIRTRRYIYAEHDDGGREMYDLDADPFQLSSVHGRPGYARERRELVPRLRRLRRCQAARCRRLPDPRLRLGGGDPCERGAVKATIERRGEVIEEVSFALGTRPAGIDRGAPFKHRLRLEDPAPSVKALVELVDGRRVSLSEQLPECER
jgi:N-acetylglucosamine-6-sulfatase